MGLCKNGCASVWGFLSYDIISGISAFKEIGAVWAKSRRF